MKQRSVMDMLAAQAAKKVPCRLLPAAAGLDGHATASIAECQGALWWMLQFLQLAKSNAVMTELVDHTQHRFEQPAGCRPLKMQLHTLSKVRSSGLL